MSMSISKEIRGGDFHKPFYVDFAFAAKVQPVLVTHACDLSFLLYNPRK